MNYLESIKISLISLKSNKMRSILTMLGIIIGVMSIVLLVSVVAGTKAKIEGEINSIGSNVFMVFPGNLEETHGPPGTYAVNKLKMRHIDLLEARSSYEVKACPMFMIMGGTIKYKRESRNTTIIVGTIPNFTHVRNWNVSSGSFFHNEDVASSRKVAIVGETIVRDLFRGADPIGKEIIVEGKKIIVIGIAESKGRTFGRDFDDLVAMPITTAQELLGSNVINQILLKVPSSDDVDKAVFETKRLLEKEMDKEDFTVTSQGEFLTMFKTFANILSVVMGAVASISLIVGGIGIMNIMLVTVRERTREIGIRKAVGAGFYDILLQFIVESTVIAIIGGLLGIIFALVILAIATPYVPFPLKASITSIIIAFSFSNIIGIFFGTYPAVKAARTDPIIALRYE